LTILVIGLTFLLPVGLILLNAVAFPDDQAVPATTGALVAWSLATLAYFAVGFAFQFGGIAVFHDDPDLAGLYWEYSLLDTSWGPGWGMIGLKGFFLLGDASTDGALTLFLSQLPLLGVATLIYYFVLLGRTRRWVILCTSLLMGGVIYPIIGNWTWAGGWLSNLGRNLSAGHGLIDVGGSGQAALVGASAALAALLVFRSTSSSDKVAGGEAGGSKGTDSEAAGSEAAGSKAAGSKAAGSKAAGGTPTVSDVSDAEHGAFGSGGLSENGSPGAESEAVLMPAVQLPLLALLGATLMVIGWMGLAFMAHLPTAVDVWPVPMAVNLALSALGGALTAGLYSWFTTSHLNPLMAARGVAAGLVVAAAGAPFLAAWAALAAGLVVGILLPLLTFLFDRALRPNDVGGVLATLGVPAILGLLLPAVFANGRYGVGWNGVGTESFLGVVGQGVSGWLVAPGFAADWPGQLHAQIVGTVAISAWSFGLSWLLVQILAGLIHAWERTGLEFGRPPEPAVAADVAPLVRDEPLPEGEPSAPRRDAGLLPDTDHVRGSMGEQDIRAHDAT
jgi:Amt family ammonium transporter